MSTNALSVISSLKDSVIRDDVLAFGEIGLGGEIRSVTNAEQRVLEAKRLGFARVVIPYHNLKKLSPSSKKGIEVVGVKNIRQAFEAVME